MKLGILGACLLFSAAMAPAQNNVLGILALPELFGSELCEPFTPSEVKLYAAPRRGRPVGSIRVDTPLKLLADGGCEGPKVSVYRRGEKAARELPVREYSYEISGAIVVDQRGRWFKVRLTGGSAWIQASKQAEFFSLERLFEGNSLTYVVEGTNGRLFHSPGDVVETVPIPGRGRDVRVVEFRMHGGQRWVNIEVMSHSICDADEDAAPRVTGRGWLPAYTAAGEPTIWFPSRGC